MIETPIEFIKAAVGVTLAAGVIGFGIWLYSSGKDLGQTVSESTAIVAKSMEDSKYTKYLNSDISGSDVLGFLRQNAGDIAITINTKCQTGPYNNTFFLASDASSFKNEPTDSGFYINPAGKFEASLERNANGVVTSMSFTQKEATYNAGTNVTESSTPSTGLQEDSLLLALNDIKDKINQIYNSMPNAANSATKEDLNSINSAILNLQTAVNSIPKDDFENINSLLANYFTNLDSSITELNSRFDIIDSSISSMFENILLLTSRTTNLESSLESIQSSLNSTGAIVSENNQQLKENDVDIEEMLERLKRLAQEIEDVKTMVSASIGESSEPETSSADLLAYKTSQSVTTLKAKQEKLINITTELEDISLSLGLSDYASELNDIKSSLYNSTTVLNALSSAVEVAK